MRHTCWLGLFLLVALPSLSQGLEEALNGKEVVLKIDMPGTQKGVDLRFDSPTLMDWKEYGKRMKQFGVAIRKGDMARITAVVRKSDRIEVQFDGGGFGTFGDDTNTTVNATVTSKSDYEKDLEKQISQATNDDRRRSLQRDLDRERARRERQDNANQQVAQIASAQKAEQVAQQRSAGGSRFNLRWNAKVPEDALTPDGIEKLLASYVSFSADPSAASPSSPVANSSTIGAPSPPNPTSPAAYGAGSPPAQLEQGMKMAEVETLLGAGKQISENLSADGLKTQVVEYTAADRTTAVTYVNGVVVQYAIRSR